MTLPTRLSALASFCCLLSTTSYAQELLYTLGEAASGNDQFGRSVANAGDVDADGVDDVIVGAPFAYTGGVQTGRAYVYSGRTGLLIWSFGGEFANDLCGWSVDGVGDTNGDGHSEVLVGAPLSDAAATNGGRFYFIDGATATIINQGQGGVDNDQFGSDVCGLGDINGDGLPEFAVSMPNLDSGGLVDCGRVYIIHASGAFSSFTGLHSGDHFGYSIDSVLATGSKDTSRMVIGAPGVDAGGVDRGYVGLYDLLGNPVAQINGATDGEWLGAAVAGVGDLNLDGVMDFAGASPYADILGVGTDAGRVRIFSGQNGAVLRTTIGATAGANFGQSVSGVGDVDDDGRPEFLVGAPNDDVAGLDTGEARVCSGANGATLFAFHGAPHDHMGRSVAGAGDLNHDGAADWVLGANAAPSGQGRAYVHLANSAAPTVYCSAKVNSLGCTPTIAGEGIASASVGNGLHVSAHNVRNHQAGILIWSRTSANNPFQGGTLCVAGPIARTAVQNAGGDFWASNCSGSYEFSFTPAYLASATITPGDAIHAQYWSRDDGASFNVGLTDALSFDVLP